MRRPLRLTLCILGCLLFLLPAACSSIPTENIPPDSDNNTHNPLPDEDEDEEKDEEHTPEEEPTPQPIYTSYIQTLTDNLNVRKGAGTNYSSLGTVEKGVFLAYLGESGSWYKTYYRNQVAYISKSSEYTTIKKIESANDKIEEVIQEGTKLLGTPYVYGAVRLHNGKGTFLSGFTTSKFDCSSLMQYIFYYGNNKQLLDVTTRTQIKQGTYVNKSNLQRGDVIFFTNESRYYNQGVERVGHVGIYLGDNYMLHTASDYAKIEKMSSTRWKYYIETRRFI